MEIPKQGDIIYLDFNPQAGHEQMGRRPALVVSNQSYNRFTRAAIVCPITNTNRSVPLHVPLDVRTRTTGVILCDQVKALDIVRREAEFVEAAPADIVQMVLEIVTAFFE